MIFFQLLYFNYRKITFLQLPLQFKFSNWSGTLNSV